MSPSEPTQQGPKGRAPLGLPIAWWVTASCACGLALGYSAFYVVIFGQLVLPLTREQGWSLAQVSGAHALSTAIIVVAAPLVGHATDRFGAFRVLVGSLFALPLALLHVTTVERSLPHFYLAIALVALAGAGTLPMTYTGLLVRWFEARRGLALGICLAGLGISQSLIPPIFQAVHQAHGWRVALMTIALAMMLVMLPATFFLSATPRAGDELDGGAIVAARNRPTGARDAAASAPLNTLALRSSLASRRFIALVFAFTLLGAANLALNVNFMPMLRDAGIEAASAGLLLSLFGASFAVTRIVAGALLDRYPPRVVAFVIVLCPAVGALLLAGDGGIALAAVAMVLFAIGMGGEFDVMAFFIARDFPREQYGRLYATVYALYNGGAVVGPLAVSTYRDRAGSFTGALIALSTVMVVAALCLSLRPREPR